MTVMTDLMRKYSPAIISILLCLFLVAGGSARAEDVEWQEKSLMLPMVGGELVAGIAEKDFKIEFDREERTTSTEYSYEFLGEDTIDGDQLMKTEMTMKGEEQEVRTLLAWFDFEFTPRRAELDGDEIPEDFIFQYIEAILGPMNRLAASGFGDFPDIEYEYIEEKEQKLDGENRPVHHLRVPVEELSDDLHDDLEVILAEFENVLGVVYYNYKGEDVEPVEIEYEVKELYPREY